MVPTSAPWAVTSNVMCDTIHDGALTGVAHSVSAPAPFTVIRSRTPTTVRRTRVVAPKRTQTTTRRLGEFRWEGAGSGDWRPDLANLVVVVDAPAACVSHCPRRFDVAQDPASTKSIRASRDAVPWDALCK